MITMHSLRGEYFEDDSIWFEHGKDPYLRTLNNTIK